MKHLGDITKIHGWEVEPVDCVTGGSPCQDLSVAGKRAGLAGARSGLFMEQVRVVKELRERDRENGRSGVLIRPRYMVWENVPGAFSSNKGQDFRAVLEEIVRIAEPDAPDVPMPEKGKWSNSGCLYDELGRWSIAWRLHDAQFWGVPQRRKRIALVADFGGLSAPEILFERKGLSWDSGAGAAQKKETAGGFGESAERADLRAADKPSGSQRQDAATCPPAVSDGERYNPATARGDHENRVTDYTALCVGNGQMGNITMKPVANTLDTMHDQQAVLTLTPWDGQARRIYSADGVAPSMANRDGSGQNQQGYLVNRRVRRLVQMECERLQGYPDDWTLLGELAGWTIWTDENGNEYPDAIYKYVGPDGKTYKTSDSARYKALGNSIALPFWFWLLRRISAQYERPALLGSLFDGIGGFPLCWERCNGKGTARWASEIEPFAIAVTTHHFPEE